MQRLALELVLTSDYTPQELAQFQRHVPSELILEALAATGTATLRRRRLPAEQVVWLIVGIAMMRGLTITQVVDRLELALPGPKPVVPSAIAKARARLGKDPLEWLFVTTADTWAHESAREHAWRGLSVYGVDGTSLRVADSDENRAHFGGTEGARGPSGYPLVRMVALMALRSHLLAAVRFGPYETHENHYAAELWSSVPPSSLVVVDKGFLGANILVPLTRGDRHFLTRAKSSTKWRVVERLGRGDEIVEMDVSRQARAKDPSLGATWRARAIRYQRKGFQPQILLTSLLDAEAYPKDEVVALYHERWEIEMGYDEIKTEMLESRESIRSKSPEGVEQEILGVLLAYNLIRLEMAHVAREAGVSPTRISFAATLEMMTAEWFFLANMTPGAIPKRLRALEARLARLLLPPRRSERRYPRAVKIKMSNYDRKRPTPTRKAAK
jgi:Insertion element 4 transposase N-terminal/Transposase DDE domain